MRFSFVSGLTLLALCVACPAKVATIEITPPKVELKNENDQKTLTATAKDADGIAIEGKVATWTSSDPAVAVIDSAGKVKPAGSGKATLTAKIEETSATAAVTVALIKGLKLESPAVVVKVGTALPPLKVAFSNEKGDFVEVKDAKIDWKTADPNVATVGPDGAISGVTPGSTTVTAKYEALNADVYVTVNPGEAAPDAGPAGDAPKEAPKK